MFTLKSVHSPFTNQSVRILCQNENGPCPLLAIGNYFAMLGIWTFPFPNSNVDSNSTPNSNDSCMVSLESLTRALADRILETVHDPELINEALSLIPTLSQGMHLNIKFNDIAAFESTSETRFFESLNIKLIHGWIIDPQDPFIFSALNDLSYNDAVLEMVQHTERGNLIRDFIKHHSHQLTIIGLQTIVVSLATGAYIFFWNNHFHLLYKRHLGEAFILVTDQGYAHRSEIVWEKLTGMDGDNIFVNNQFEKSNITSSLPSTPTAIEAPSSQESHLDADYALALSLMEQENHHAASLSSLKNDSLQQHHVPQHLNHSNQNLIQPSSPNPFPSSKPLIKHKQSSLCRLM